MFRFIINLAALLLVSGAAFAQAGTGLTGKYYDTDSFSALKTTRTDAAINYHFGTEIPTGTALTAATSYSIAWSGQIVSRFSELYNFTVTADDGARLWVDDQLLVQRTYFPGTGEIRGQIRMKAGHRVNLRLEYIQTTGNASVKLEWASPSQPRQVVPAESLYPASAIPNGGSLLREVWLDLPGTSISTLTSNPGYPSKPASREFLSSFECLAQDWEDNYGTRVTGFVRAPVSGDYTFAVSGDEVVKLYLSSDASVANKSLIAKVSSATGFRQWDAQPGQQSTTRPLLGGQGYYVELLHKESSGADHWSVGWKLPGEADFQVIPATALMMPGTELPTPGMTDLFSTLATEQPRLGVSRERFIWLKQQFLSPAASLAKSRAQAVVAGANSDLTRIPNYDHDIARLATAWWLTGEARYAERLWVRLQDIMAHGDYSVKWKGTTLLSVAMGYDWLYPYWSAEQRSTLLDFLVNKGLTSQADKYQNNIGIQNDSGFLMAALAVGTVNEGAAKRHFSQAYAQLLQKIDQWEPNAGAWLEGTDYGILAKMRLAEAMRSLESSLGSYFSIGRVPGFFTARREPLTIASNTRQRFTFSDVGTGSNNGMGWANWWARRYDAPETYDFSRLAGNSTWNALLLPETTLSAVQLNPDTCFQGPADAVRRALAQHVATFRENWTDPKATFVGAMGGTFMSHGMLQSGTFQLCARGVNWFVDLKSENYDLPGYNITAPRAGADRWDYYRMRAEGHNCLIINPGPQPDRIWNAPPAPMTTFQSDPNGQRSFAVWDLSKNLSGVTRVQRGVQLFNKRKEVLVQDEILLPGEGKAWWFAHFRNDQVRVTISPDGSSVMLQQGRERLWGKIVCGSGTWSIRAARPLPTSPNPAGANPNELFSKLAIYLPSVTDTTLAVWFVPLAPGDVPPTTTPTITPLKNWDLGLAGGKGSGA